MRRTFSFWLVAIIIPLFSASAALAEDIGADGPLQTVTNPSSAPYQNILEVAAFIRQISLPAMADDLVTALKAGRIAYGKNLTHNGVRAHGVTTSDLRIYFNSSLIDTLSPVKIRTPGDEQGLEVGLRLFNVAVHELFHYQDFEDTIFEGDAVSENTTYKRSNQQYTTHLRRMLETYRELSSAGHAHAEWWLTMLTVYGRLLGSEFLDYSTEEFGEIDDRYVPLPVHDGCVETLSRSQYGRYATEFQAAMGNPNVGADERLANFDDVARYYWGKKDRRCLDQKTLSLPPLSQSSVGYASPTTRQEIFEIRRHTNGRMLHIVKSGENAGKVEVFATATRADIEELHLLEFGRLDQSETDERYSYPPNSNTIYVIVSELLPGTYPESGVELRFTEQWYDETNRLREVPLASRRMATAEHARIGLFPPKRLETFADFDLDSHFERGSFDFQITGTLFTARAGQHATVRVPAFDNRQVEIHRATIAAGGGYELDLMRTITVGQEQASFDVREDGDYVVLITRHFARRKGSYFPVAVDIANKGVQPRGPFDSTARVLTDADLAMLGAHQPKTFTISSRLRQPDLNVGWMYRRGAGSFEEAFAPFQVIELHFSPDRMIEVLPTAPNAAIYLFSRDSSGEWRFDLTLLPETVNRLLPSGDAREYFLIVHGHGLDEREGNTEIHLRYMSARPGGLADGAPELLSAQAVRTRFGIGTSSELRFDEELLTGAHPRDFLVPGGFYQLYELTVDQDTLLEIHLPYEGVDRLFILTEVLNAEWNAGRAALNYIFQARSIHTPNVHHLELKKGRYFFALETAYGQRPGESPFSLRYIFTEAAQGKTRVRKLNAMEMSDPRLRLKR